MQHGFEFLWLMRRYCGSEVCVHGGVKPDQQATRCETTECTRGMHGSTALRRCVHTKAWSAEASTTSETHTSKHTL